MRTHEEYLGDAVYASFDGDCIWLQTKGGTDDQHIALEPRVFEALIDYVERLRREMSPTEGGSDG